MGSKNKITDKHTFTPSLNEVNASINTQTPKTKFRRLLAFFGPAYLVSVGYMDPGNWATDIAGGSQFGYQLLWVLMMSNLIALLLQSLSARLGVVRNRDLAQASRETYPKYINISLYVLAEIAIAATDLAEVLGMAIGLQLLFGFSLTTGVLITVFDTILLLFLMNLGMRKMEMFIISLVGIIGMSFFAEIFFAKPDVSEILTGLIPSTLSNEALYIAIGIIGATVMPHNLYLHSSLVQTRKIERTDRAIRKAIRFNIADSAIALNMAFFVNAAILILAAAVFHKSGMFDVAEIQDAHKLLEPMLGNKLAPILFAVALIAAGQSSTVTGTLSGQIVMEGYINLRIAPWIRRLLTRLIAIIPALITVHFFGERSSGDLLVLSQVILSLQLGFAIIPLIHFVSDKDKMGVFAINTITKIFAWLCATIIVALNIKLVFDFITEFLTGESSLFLKIPVALVSLAAIVLLIVVTLYPLILRRRFHDQQMHQQPTDINKIEAHSFKRIVISLDFSKSDTTALNHALNIGGKEPSYLLIHVVESAGALAFGHEIEDKESQSDKIILENYTQQLLAMGYKVENAIGFGNPKRVIPSMVNSFDADLLVMGAHGHRGIKDFVFGTTINTVRHRVKTAVLVV
ncbi:MAG TPA: Nramp family divalent metal transporter [Bacteroidia bacterium]|nr:MAG: Divalent metal cation transporter MntH [Bacteroidetes bacterium ADurb.Bin141]HNR47638.1 Nramp family divalent metal transporter [Bacteroidia bacterium]HNT81531.1 Nramp family divalent metal transporter [Bacteroidia bacterium]